MMTFPKDCDHVILFGGSPLLVKLAKALRDREFSLDIYTAPRQESEPVGPNGETLGSVLTKAGLDFYIISKDINQDLPLHTITPTTLGIGLGEAWQFKAPILDAFQGRLLDLMGIPLPRYRGGAHYTWAIMNQEFEWGCCLQEVTANTMQGECDDGAIVYQKSYRMPALALTPKDWFDECGKFEIDFLTSFFQLVKAGKAFNPVMPDEHRSLYFPRLKTTEQGWVDWSWSGSDIADFINAFDVPYPGAQTTIDGKTVQLRGAEWFEHDAFHPFTAGLVLRMERNRVVVATKGGWLHIDQVIGADVRCGQRFHTSRERLERALTYTPNYTAAGDQQVKEDHRIAGKKVTLRTLTLADCTERYLTWLNDPEVNRFLESRFQTQTRETLRSFVKNMESSAHDYLFAIEENESGTHIGNIKIGCINWTHRYADIGYFIGNKGLWGRGLATEAIKLATEFAFRDLGLHHMRAGVYETNVGSIKALRKAGYAFQGIWADQLIDGDKRIGHAWLTCTADAWAGVEV